MRYMPMRSTPLDPIRLTVITLLGLTTLNELVARLECVIHWQRDD
jgi:hypothetical protein